MKKLISDFKAYGVGLKLVILTAGAFMLILGMLIGSAVQRGRIAGAEKALGTAQAEYSLELSKKLDRIALLEGDIRDRQIELDALKGFSTTVEPQPFDGAEAPPAAGTETPVQAPDGRDMSWVRVFILMFVATVIAATLIYIVYCIIRARREDMDGDDDYDDDDDDDYDDDDDDDSDDGDSDNSDSDNSDGGGDNDSGGEPVPVEPAADETAAAPKAEEKTDAPEGDIVLSVRNLKKSFGSLDVLKDISFDLRRGEVISVLGPSGGGKSTLLRCLTQLESIDDGLVTVDGDVMFENGEYAPRAELSRITLKIGLVFQSFNLFPHLSVMDNITVAPMKVKKTPRDQAEKRALALLERVGLSDKADCYPYQLSGGQQQRVAIARALALDPEVLFFDEPTSALDPELTGEVLKVIRSLADRSITMIIVTHEMGFARSVSDRVIFMENGVIVEDAAPEELFTNPKNPRTRDFIASVVEK